MAAPSEAEGMAQSISEAIIRLRWVVIVACLVVTVVCALGMRFHVDEATGKLVVETDSRVYFGPNNPDLIALESLEATFTKDNNLLIVLAPKNGNIFTRETLAIVEDLTEQAWQTPYSRRVDSVTNYQHSYAEGDDLIISDLVSGAADLTDEDLERVREIANAQVELYRKIVSEKGDVTAVNITVLNPGESLNEIPEIVTYVRDLAAKTREAHPEVDVY